MIRTTLGLLASAFLILSLHAAEPSMVLIHLTDKSQVKGHILEMQDGAYKVKTDKLGVLTIKADDIARIDYKPESVSQSQSTHQPQAQSQGLGQADRLNALFGFEEILQQVLANPDTMKDIQKLAEDPAFIAVLDDPEIAKAIEDGNFIALARNKKIWSLMSHPAVKDITNQVKAGKPSEEAATSPQQPRKEAPAKEVAPQE